MYGLIPLPASIEPLSGNCILDGLPVMAQDSGFAGEARVLSEWLDRALARHGRAANSTEGGRAANSTEGGYTSASVTLGIFQDQLSSGSEAYRLFIRPGLIELHVASGAGVIRGAATLAQLVSACGPTLPCLAIVDQPRFQWRGFMLDTVRNYFAPAFIKRQIELAALHKLNRFHWHLTDDQGWRPELPGLPELSRMGAYRVDGRFNAVQWKGGVYTADDIRDIVDFAARLHVVVVPEVDVPGHSSALLASHPELWCRSSFEGRRFEPEDRYGVFDAVLCAGRDESLELTGAVFSGLAELFPSRWLHAGGDEVPKLQWLSCPHCRERMSREGLLDRHGERDPERLQAWFMEQVRDQINRSGRVMIGWDELVDGGCAKDVLIMAWRSSEHGKAAAEKGYKVIMCPQSKACYLDHKHLDCAEEPGQLGICTVRDAYSFEPVPPGTSAAIADNILGGQANLWTELVYFGRQAEYMLYPRLCAISEVLWSRQEGRDFTGFTERLEPHRRWLDAWNVNQYRGPLE